MVLYVTWLALLHCWRSTYACRRLGFVTAIYTWLSNLLSWVHCPAHISRKMMPLATWFQLTACNVGWLSQHFEPQESTVDYSSVSHRHPTNSAISGYFWYPKSWDKAWISHGSLLKKTHGSIIFHPCHGIAHPFDRVVVPWTIHWCIFIPAIGLPFGGISVYSTFRHTNSWLKSPHSLLQSPEEGNGSLPPCQRDRNTSEALIPGGKLPWKMTKSSIPVPRWATRLA